MINFIKLRSLIRLSNLSFEDIDNLVMFFSKAKDDKLEKIINLLDKDPKSVYEINRAVKELQGKK